MLHNPQKFNLSNLAKSKGECGSLLLFSPLLLGMWPAFPEVFPTTRIHLLQVKSSYLWMQYVDFKRLKWWWSPQLIRQYISRQPFTPFPYVQGIRIGPTFGPKWCQSICWDALHPPSSGKMKGQYNRAFSPKNDSWSWRWLGWASIPSFSCYVWFTRPPLKFNMEVEPILCCLSSWESKGTPPKPTPPTNKNLIRAY